MAATLAIHTHAHPTSTAHRRRSPLPFVVAGSVAFALGTGGALIPSHSADAHTGPSSQRPGATPLPRTAHTAVKPAQSATPPAQYTVVEGDTVTGIAARYDLTPASVLAENGLSWGSIIHPGQTLVLGPGARPFQGSPASSTAAGQHTIVVGDTVTAIATRYGTSVDAILTANGLTPTSIIYPGQSLIIPATVLAATNVTPLSASPAPTRSGSAAPTSLSDEMAHNAEIIVSVGLELGVNEQALVIALATAMQESSLRNLNWGDRDSRGLFQQRPSTGWGTVAQVTDPRHASRLFFGGPRNPNAGKTRGLLDIPGWEKMSVNDAAQAVQLSGHPFAYAKWESAARAWVAELLR